VCLLAGEPIDRAKGFEVLLKCEAFEEAELVGQDTDELTNLHGVLNEVETGNAKAACVRSFEAGEELEECRFACAIRTEQGANAGFDSEGEAVEDGAATVSFADVLALNHVRE
jgi:hypothetical protein